MHSSKKKSVVSVAMVATNLELNGISSVIMNYVQYLDLNRFKITIIVGESVAPKYQRICNEKGIKVVILPHRKKDSKGFYLGLLKAFCKGKYDIAHVHGSNASIGLELFLAKIAGIKIRIAHSHNTTSTSMKIHKLMKPVFNMSYTDGFACGKKAGQWLFGNKKFVVIPNGVEVENFKFDQLIREKVRKDLGLSQEYIVGHIGRFNYQKNHEFILKAFEEVVNKRPDSRLLLVGDGPDYADFKEKVKESPAADKVILYGETNKPSDLYMAMDSFLFPSRFEGLPVTLIEGQITGLKCLVSDVITEEVKLSDNLEFCSLKDTPAHWAQKLLDIRSEDRNSFYEKHQKEIMHYYVKNDVELLEKAYEKILDREGI